MPKHVSSQVDAIVGLLDFPCRVEIRSFKIYEMIFSVGSIIFTIIYIN